MFSHIPLMACSKINDAGSTIGGFFAVQIHGKSLRGHRLDRVMAPPRALHYLFTGGTCALAWCTRPSSSRVHGEPAMALWPTSLRNNGPILAVFAIFEELKCQECLLEGTLRCKLHHGDILSGRTITRNVSFPGQFILSTLLKREEKV